jgi:putative transposase
MHLPHLPPFKNAPIVFVTTCTHRRQPLLAGAVAHEILHDIWTQSAHLNGWFVGHYILMPDHVHLFACPQQGAPALAGWMQIWKTIAAKRINRALGRKGAFWQADYFDRFLRSLKDYSQKWDYVALNAARKGLVTHPEDWPYRGTIHDLHYHASRD